MTAMEAAEFLDTTKQTIHRYARTGKLPYESKKGVRHFKKRDLLRIAEDLHRQIEKHRPDSSPQEKPLTQRQVVKKVIKSPTKSLLNEDGIETYKETIKHLTDNDLLRLSTEKVVLRYALASQLKDTYLGEAKESGEKIYFDLAAQFQREIQHYEKELGLTPASLVKIKPPKEEKIIDVDPMEELLSD